jgi:hypothetical protein
MILLKLGTIIGLSKVEVVFKEFLMLRKVVNHAQ